MTLHKAIIRYDQTGCTGHAASMQLSKAAIAWLKANGREDNLVNCCDNFGALVLVLSDRDTALMLKLALA